MPLCPVASVVREAAERLEAVQLVGVLGAGSRALILV